MELDFTGRLANGAIFDTTEKDVAKKEQIEAEVESVIVCVGQKQVVPGLDSALEGKPIGKFTVKVSPEDGFGKKDPKLLRLIPLRLFNKEKIQPVPGLEVEVDNQRGTIRSVSGGRVIVDFNHPLASEELTYEVNVKRKVEDKKGQAEAILKMFHLPFTSTELNEDKLTINISAQLPDQLLETFKHKLVELVKIKDVEFKAK